MLIKNGTNQCSRYVGVRQGSGTSSLPRKAPKGERGEKGTVPWPDICQF